MSNQKKTKSSEMGIQGGKPVRDTMLVFGRPDIGEAEINAVSEVIRSKWIGVGPKVKLFEQRVHGYIGAKYTVATNSASAGLHISLLLSGVGRGDEVITSPITFPSTVNMIENVGATPVFVDIDPSTGLLTPENISKAITKKTKAIMVVHLYGNVCDMNSIWEIAEKNNLIVIEDAAEAFGAEIDGYKVGSKSHYASFSFAVNKVVTTAEGGIVVSNIENVGDKLRRFVVHGMDPGVLKKYPYRGYSEHMVTFPGLKYNMTDIHAAIGLVNMDRVDSLLDARDGIAKMYDEGLVGLPLKLIQTTKNSRHGRCFYAILLDQEKLSADRDTIQEALLAENIGTAVHFFPMHLQPYYVEKYNYKRGDYPNAEKFSDITLSLPIASDLTVRDINSVIKAVRKVLLYFSK